MRKRVLLSIIMFLITITLSFAENIIKKNPTHEEVWNEAVTLGKKWVVPPEIIYSIAYVESEFTQYNDDGTPFIDRGSVGIMQVLPKYMDFYIDIKRLKTDWRYNMEIGIRILLDKWEMQNKVVGKRSKATMHLPKIGDGNRMVLESWYFSLWAYNHWGEFNNPNYRKTLGKNARAFQEKVIDVAKKRFGFEITKIDNSKLDDRGLPKPGVTFEYPTKIHYSVIVEKGFFEAEKKLMVALSPKEYMKKYMDKYINRVN